MLEGLIQHDDLRGTQNEVGLYVRVPFGPRPGHKLGRIERRMVDRIVRDVDVVANDQTIDDPANFASTGVAINSVRVVDANDDPSAEMAAAGEDSVVVVDGSASIISEGDTTVLNSGQVVIGGGGSTLNVVGRNTGAQAQFTTPGTRPLVNGTAVSTDVFQIANDSTLTGLDITGGNNGVFGDSVTGFMLRDLNISGAAEDGVSLDGTNSGDIRNVVSNFNGGSGFAVFNFNSGTISGNTASKNDQFGFFVGTFPDGIGGFNSAVFSNNSSINNTLLGYNFLTGTPFSGGMTNTGSGNGGNNSF